VTKSRPTSLYTAGPSRGLRTTPDSCTLPAANLLLDIFRIMSILETTQTTTHVAQSFAKALRAHPGWQHPHGRLPGHLSKAVNLGLSADKALTELLPTLKEMLYCRAVDSYLTYITDLAALVFKTRPDCLKSEEQVSHAVVLSCPTRDDLVAQLTDRSVYALSHDGLWHMHSTMQRKAGLPLFMVDADLSEGIRVAETRNLLVHSRGIATISSVRNAKALRLKPGDRVRVSEDMLATDAWFLLNAGLDLDARAIVKHGLPVQEEATPEHAAYLKAMTIHRGRACGLRKTDKTSVPARRKQPDADAGSSNVRGRTRT
jgi:hypothetical protein